MRIDQLTPDDAVFKELGARLVHIRKLQGIKQQTLASSAGIGVATLRRMESGQDAQLGSWLKVLRALRMVGGIEALVPAAFDSPMDEALGGIRRRRPSGTADEPFRWGDEGP